MRQVLPVPVVSLTGWIGRRTLYVFSQLVDLVVFFGNALMIGRKHRNVWNWATYSSVLAQTIFSGIDALPVLTILGLAIGIGVTAQLIHLIFALGNIIDVAHMLYLVIGMELGPIITAIVLIGRSGSAITVDLGSMKVNRQIESLEALGVDVDDVFVIPRLFAITLSQVILALWLSFIILFSGIIFSALVYGTATTTVLHELSVTSTLTDTFYFFIKNVVFGLAIGTVACFYGLKAETASTDVAQQTQRSIISSIASIFVIDGIFMVLVH